VVTPKLAPPILCLVTDRTLCRSDFLPEKIEQAVAGGVKMVQLREKDLPASELLKLAEAIERKIAGRALLLINDRIDIALSVNADGVHLGESGMPVAIARRLLGPGKLVGRSVHSLSGARAAEAEGASYLIAGTIYETRSKPGKLPEGTTLLQEITSAVRIPCLGIGGVTAQNVKALMETGAAGAAVVSGLLSSRNPESAARALLSAMGAGPLLQAAR
jgi:thiamine-phosphate pyrophosphorylase